MIQLDVIEQALLAPCMDSVIAVSERYQYLSEHKGARVFTAYREVDHTLCVGFAKDLNQVCLLYTSPSPRDKRQPRMPSSA